MSMVGQRAGLMTRVGRGFSASAKASARPRRSSRWASEGGTPRQAGHGHPTAQACAAGTPREGPPYSGWNVSTRTIVAIAAAAGLMLLAALLPALSSTPSREVTLVAKGMAF